MLFALRTSTATYLPMSDQATMASTLVSVAMTTRTGRSRAATVPGASSTRSLYPSLGLLSRPRTPNAAVIAFTSSGVAPTSRRIAETESPFLSTKVRSFQALPPVIWAVVFGSNVTFSGTMRGWNPEYGSPWRSGA